MYEGLERRKHPRVTCQIPVQLIAADGSTPVAGSIANIGAGGLLAICYRPVTFVGLEPCEAIFRLGEQEVRLKGDWSLRGNARVIALEFRSGQEAAIAAIRAFVREASQVEPRPTGRTTRRVTLPRRDEAITIRRMLKAGKLGSCDPFLEQPVLAAGEAVTERRSALSGLARLLGL